MTELATYEEPDRIEEVWRRLETTARPSYSQSWGWIENWLSTQDHPLLDVVLEDGEPIAAAFDGMPVLRAPSFPALGMQGADFRVVVDREIGTPLVDLDTVRAAEGGYLATLPSAIRAHLAHTRLQLGELEVEAATDAVRAHVVFDELLDLKGAPDDAFFRRLITQRAPSGEIQLLRIRARNTTLGCLYNVMWHDHAAYQLAGYAALEDADVCHVAAIEHNANRGMAFYELQHADARLATGETRRVILRLYRRQRIKLAG
jgi:CelD/BcsL family acetyltransferase involved in cellulose biosynthesis